MIESAGRQLWLEIRRNEYRWFFLVVAIGTGLALTDRLSGPVVFWSDVTLAWRDALYVLGPWIAAAAVWTAGRERRHGLEDLLATTARPPFRRRMWSLVAVTVLGVLAFGLIGGWLALTSVQRIAWGELDWAVIVIANMALVSSALFGFAVGCWKPRRATAFAVMIGLALLQLILAGTKGWQSFLTATPKVGSSAWSGITPDFTGAQFFLFAGFIAIGLTFIATQVDRGWFGRGVLAVSAVVIVLAIASLIGQDDPIQGGAPGAGSNGGEFGAPAPGTYAMICYDSQTVVCVHPAFEPMLEDASNQINALISALGRPAGSPERINLHPGEFLSENGGTWNFALNSVDPDGDLHVALLSIEQLLLSPPAGSVEQLPRTAFLPGS